MFTLGNYALSILLLQLLISFNEFNGISCEHMSEGQTCTNDGKSGVCLSLEKCPLLEKNIKSKKLLPINYYCGFKENNVAIYCCTDIPVDLEVKASNFSQPLPKPGSNVIIYPKEAELLKKFYLMNSTVITTTDTGKLQQIPRLTSTIRKSNKRPAEIACDEIRSKYPGIRLIGKITEGKMAGIGEFPHMVALGYKLPGIDEFQWICGGSLISDQYILTAAHCITESRRPTVARMGRINIKIKNCMNFGECDGYDVDIDDIISHKNYDTHTKYNDIALIRLKERFDNEKFELHPACLYTKTDDFNENLNLTITGWGVTNYITRERSDFLLKGIVKAVAQTKCSEIYTPFLGKGDLVFEKGLSDKQLCAHDEKSDTCQGDSGGPIQIADDSWIVTVIGVTSVGIPCPGKLPGIYTRVASHLDWIESIVWPDLKN